MGGPRLERRPLQVHQGEASRVPGDTQIDVIKYFAKLGLPTNPLIRLCDNVDEMLEAYGDIEAQRSRLDYDIDGVVYKVNRIDWQQRWVRPAISTPWV